MGTPGNATQNGSEEERHFTVSMLARQIEVSVPAAALVSQLREAIEREVHKPKVKLVATDSDGVSFDLSDERPVADLAIHVDIVAVAEAVPLVIENGSHTMRAGFAGEEQPRLSFRTTLAKPSKGDAYTFGLEVDEIGEGETLVQPISHGLVRDWEAMENIWRHIFMDLDIGSVKGQSLVFTEPPLNPKANRVKLMQTMFDLFEVESFFMSLSQVLKLYECGRSTGVVADIGARGRVVLPIYEGFSLLMAVEFCSEQGGEDLCDELQAVFSARDPSGQLGKLDRRSIRKIKETMCYVAEDIEEERRLFQPQVYEDPDRGKLTLGPELFEVAELFFADSQNLCDDIHASLSKTDMNCRFALMDNILLTGGSAALRGLKPRLTKELAKKWPAIQVLLVPEPGNSAWSGGSCLSSTPDYDSTPITKCEFQAAMSGGDDGTHEFDRLIRLVERKCF